MNQSSYIDPTHILQHWRSATSTELFSLHGPSLEACSNRFVTEIEAEFGPKSATSAHKRTEELKKIVQDILQFKQRLECQADSYHFEVYGLNTPFDREWMSSLNGLDAPDSKVEYTISPTFYKLVKPNTRIVIERARVKLR